MTDAEELAAYRAMHRFARERGAEAERKTAALTAQGKEKTAAYRQIWADKLFYKNVLALYRTHGLEQT